MHFDLMKYRLMSWYVGLTNVFTHRNFLDCNPLITFFMAIGDVDILFSFQYIMGKAKLVDEMRIKWQS